MSKREDIVFSRNTVEFVTVAAEFCAYVERANEYTRKEFIETLLKLLPLLYLKALMLPDDERINVPSNRNHCWNYRMHISIEQLMEERAFNDTVRGMIIDAGRML